MDLFLIPFPYGILSMPLHIKCTMYYTFLYSNIHIRRPSNVIHIQDFLISATSVLIQCLGLPVNTASACPSPVVSVMCL